MTLVSLRPSSTVSNTGTLTGAASAHAATSDNSDASYVTYAASGEKSILGLTDLTLPGGALISSVVTRVRVGTSSDGTLLASTVGSVETGGLVVPPLGPATVQAGPPSTTWTDAALDAATFALDWVKGNVRVFEAYTDVRYVVLPVVTVTAPTGTITNTNTPTVIWANTLDSDGGGQTGYHVKIFTAAQYGIGGFDPAVSPNTYDSGAQGGSGTSLGLTTLLANATYRAYVRTRQTVNGALHWSAWAFSGFVITVTMPTPRTRRCSYAEPWPGSA